MPELSLRRDHRASPDAAPPRSAWSRARSIATTVLLVAVSAFAFVTVVLPLLLGGQTYSVLTGSMQPGMPPGTMIAVRPTPIEEVRIGDVVTFQMRSGEPAVATHRVVGTTSSTGGGRLLITRGDANDVDDPPVQSEQLRGVVVLAVPFLGYPAMLFGGEERGAVVAAIGVVVVGYGLGLLAIDAIRTQRRRARERRVPTVFLAASFVAATAIATASLPVEAHADTGAASLERLLVSGDGARFVADGSVSLFPRTSPYVPGATTPSTLWVRNASGDPARAGLRLDSVPTTDDDRAFAAALHLVVGDAVIPSGGQWVSGVIPPGETVRLDVALRMDPAAGNETRLAEAVLTPTVRLTESVPDPSADDNAHPSAQEGGTLPWTGLRSTPFGGVVVAAAILATLGLALRARADERR
ncbi:signal peptidase I [Microbacterium testaceum]|uniref:signal peptidase I n=1 Tax=Microbacterium testaceum TaxID=2033 RepID=UPI001244B5AA|nr:signal peptidase I [Microbacterium testaceum]